MACDCLAADCGREQRRSVVWRNLA
jgi:hypothetical protein